MIVVLKSHIKSYIHFARRQMKTNQKLQNLFYFVTFLFSSRLFIYYQSHKVKELTHTKRMNERTNEGMNEMS